MRFMLTTYGGGTPPDEVMYAEMGKLVEEMSRAGVLLATGGLDQGVHVKSAGGKLTVTDGPFTEAKEAVVGWAIVEVGSREEAIELSKRFWAIVGDGQGTIQRIYDPGEMPGS